MSFERQASVMNNLCNIPWPSPHGHGEQLSPTHLINTAFAHACVGWHSLLSDARRALITPDGLERHVMDLIETVRIKILAI